MQDSTYHTFLASLRRLADGEEEQQQQHEGPGSRDNATGINTTPWKNCRAFATIVDAYVARVQRIAGNTK